MKTQRFLDNFHLTRKTRENRYYVRWFNNCFIIFRLEMKSEFNENFGSVFRSKKNPTFFSRRLFRVADVYTSRVTNFNNFPLGHTFYPRRGALPHEFKSWFV